MPKLIVSEKPSVAQAIGKALGITKRHDGYLEGEEYLVSWCVGHLVELAPPDSYDSKLAKWSKADLPACLCHRCRAGRRADFPACLSPVQMQETLYPALDQQHGGCRHPGWIRPPQTLN